MTTDVMDLIQTATPLSGTIDATDHEQIAALLGARASDDYMDCEVTHPAMLPKFSYAVRYYLEGGEEFRRRSEPDATCYEAALVHRYAEGIHNISVKPDNLSNKAAIEDCIVRSIKHLFVIAEINDIDVLKSLQESLNKSASTYIVRAASQQQADQQSVKKPAI